MTDARLNELRGLLRAGRLDAELFNELRDMVRRLARFGRLPVSAAPYGRWDDEAADELFSSWYADRLLGRGHLQALLDRAATVAAFSRLAERSLRQHLSNQRDRSQAQNLYHRVVATLVNADAFALAVDAARPQDRWWRLKHTEAPPWSGSDRDLMAAAWALGDFVVLRYRGGARKLAPVLDGDELLRFIRGLMTQVDAALTPALVMRVLSARFDLGDVELMELDETIERTIGVDTSSEAIVLRDTARWIASDLSARQLEVLRRTPDQTLDEIAAALGCSVGTIINEQRRVGAVVTRYSEDNDERDALLRILYEALYLEGDE